MMLHNPQHRPTKCGICRKQMYYYGFAPWEPELNIMIDHFGISPKKYWHPQYVHLKCWNNLATKRYL